MVLWLEASVFRCDYVVWRFCSYFPATLLFAFPLFYGDPFPGNLLTSFFIFLSLFHVFIMSDQSDSHNAFNEAFITGSDPSSPSVDRDSTIDLSPVGRTRLLADIPPTVERERELRSKFLNDPSTPEEHNLTLRYLTASQNGDEQMLRELRHQISARRSRRHPPIDVVPSLDVAPLREHAWFDILADAEVRVSSDFYDRLQSLQLLTLLLLI